MIEIDRSQWRRVRFGDVVRQVKDRVDPETAGVSRYVAGEHMDSQCLALGRWGTVGDGYLGPAFHMRFRPSQVLFGSRRTYLKKVAVPEFEGICANTTYVAESADPAVLEASFLPHLMSSEPFLEHAIRESKGSVNPYVNWSDLAKWEFNLPSPAEQRRIAALLWALESYRRSSDARDLALGVTMTALLESARHETVTLGQLVDEGAIRFLTGPFGTSLSASEYVFDAVPVINPTNMRAGEITVDRRVTVPEHVAERLARWRVSPGDLVLMRKGDIGRSALISPDQEGWVLGSDCISIRVLDSDRLLPRFLRAGLSRKAAIAELLRRAPGTTMPGISEKSLGPVHVPLPSLDAQQEILAELDQLDARRRAAGHAVQHAAEVRRCLIQTILGADR